MRLVVLSLDYEIFGNGTGDVVQHVTAPTERMARLCGQRRMPLTVFFEAEEYLAFTRHARALRADLGYDPAQLMREQAAWLAAHGHDVQLHLHPQWHGAAYREGRWTLFPEHPTVDSLFATTAEATAYLAERKAAIEELISTAKPGRKVRVYRAGAFSAQPGLKLLAALRDNGFVIDSSVVRGLHRREGQGSLDYRAAPAGRPMWCVETDVAVEAPAGALWEIPIGSRPGRRFHQATWGRLKAKFSRNVPRERQSQMVRELGLKAGPVQLARFLWQRIPIKFDFHNVRPARLLQWIKQVPAPPDGSPDVVVLIGHSKEHLDDRGFDRLLEGISRDPELRVVTFDHVAGLLANPAVPAS